MRVISCCTRFHAPSSVRLSVVHRNHSQTHSCSVGLDVSLSQMEQSDLSANTDPRALTNKITLIRDAGPSKFQVIADFDATLTRYRVNGLRGQTSHGLLQQGNEYYDAKRQALYEHYHPLEISPVIPIEEKTKLMEEWWTKTHDLLIEGGLTYDAIKNSVANSSIAYRDGVTELFEFLEKKEIPVLIFSAGLADVIEEVLRQNLHRTFKYVKIVSNRMVFNDDGQLVSFKGKLIHVLNKNEHALDMAAPFHDQLGSIVGYWCAAFILPAKCIMDLEKLCRRFLWSGGADLPKQSKVRWKQVCSPKNEGGLGLKDLKLWNRIYGLKLIWLLFSSSGSLWVAWCKRYRLRRKSFWSLPLTSQGSSMWKQILRLRDLAKIYLSCEIGDGNTCAFWYDNWTPFGQLYTFLGPDEHRRLGLPLDAKVADAWQGNGWIFRGARSLNTELLLCHLTSVQLSRETSDCYLWASSDGRARDRFCFADTWRMVRPTQQEVAWHKQVWFPGSVPKHSFNLWLCCLDRLPTRSRLRSWGMVNDDTCPLCDTYEETRDHLFLTCPYSYEIWSWAMAKLQITFSGFNSWDCLLSCLKSPARDRSFTSLKLITAQAIIYSIWRERNTRIFTGLRTPAPNLFRGIDRGIRNTCSARKHCERFKDALQLWFRGSCPSLF